MGVALPPLSPLKQANLESMHPRALIKHKNLQQELIMQNKPPQACSWTYVSMMPDAHNDAFMLWHH
jgi:hypothetical protein